MRLTPILGALTVMWFAAPSLAQMTEPTPAPQTQNQPQGGMMMCAPATTGQGGGQDKTSKPMQMGMMCPCCQAMMKKGMMQKMQKMPEQMPGMDSPQ